MTSAMCTNVERGRRNGVECLALTASVTEDVFPLPVDKQFLTVAKADLRALGVTLGSTQRGRTPVRRPSFSKPDVAILVSEEGRQILVKEMDVFEVSTGSTLVRLFVFDLSDELQWLIGRPIWLSEKETWQSSL